MRALGLVVAASMALPTLAALGCHRANRPAVSEGRTASSAQVPSPLYASSSMTDGGLQQDRYIVEGFGLRFRPSGPFHLSPVEGREMLLCAFSDDADWGILLASGESTSEPIRVRDVGDAGAAHREYRRGTRGAAVMVPAELGRELAPYGTVEEGPSTRAWHVRMSHTRVRIPSGFEVFLTTRRETSGVELHDTSERGIMLVVLDAKRERPAPLDSLAEGRPIRDRGPGHLEVSDGTDGQGNRLLVHYRLVERGGASLLAFGGSVVDDRAVMMTALDDLIGNVEVLP